MSRMPLIIAFALLSLLSAPPLVAGSGPDEPDSTGLRFSLQELLAAADEDTSQASKPIADGVQLLYFHRTIRCGTCLGMEQSIRTLLRAEFSGDLEARRLQWCSLDFQDEANSALSEAYQVQGPTLVLIRSAGGEIEDSRTLTRIWEIEEPEALDRYLKQEISGALGTDHNALPDSSAK